MICTKYQKANNIVALKMYLWNQKKVTCNVAEISYRMILVVRVGDLEIRYITYWSELLEWNSLFKTNLQIFLMQFPHYAK